MTEKPRPRLALFSTRRRTLTVCAVPVVALLAVAAFAPLPFSLAQPGDTADVLGENAGKPVISFPDAKDGGKDTGEAGKGEGKLLAVTIGVTNPDVTVRAADVARAWFAEDRAVMPREAAYPEGDSVREVKRSIHKQMKDSQDKAVTAALRQLGKKPGDVDVSLRLGDVGGPSAGLLFSLGIVDKLEGDLTGGRTIAGTGTIDAQGKVGPVGGVPLKMRAAKRDGARHFLVPEKECGEAEAQRPKGLRLIPVTTLDKTLDSLKALKDGGKLPSC
ncbi:S16 family serine protease [Streptomyces sp. NPDC048172]|uniref:S16 family serine protease n=1 Tax=Streptomyces sp. NPDC048172 TaxID=3365505 RepID=UPI00371BDD9B